MYEVHKKKKKNVLEKDCTSNFPGDETEDT